MPFYLTTNVPDEKRLLTNTFAGYNRKTEEERVSLIYSTSPIPPFGHRRCEDIFDCED